MIGPRSWLMLILVLLGAPFAIADRISFSSGKRIDGFGRSRSFDLKHVRLELRFDLEGGRVAGKAVNIITPLAVPLHSVRFDGVDLVYATVVDSRGRSLAHESDGRTIEVQLAEALAPGSEESITIEYEARPKMGLYFNRPDSSYPAMRREVWSIGWTEFNRHWYPSYDYPNDMATSEMIVTVPRPLRVISNGALLGTRENTDGTRTFHWKESVPHSTYLNSIVVGEYAELVDRWKETPVTYYVPPESEADARRSFGKTPAMIEFFSAMTGYDYPFEQYAQTTVSRFIIGGMENVSAATLTTNTLHDERAHQDVDSDGLVSHELAHMWFGDTVTNRDWSNMWLNEGFATYFQALFFEHDRGPEAFALERDSMRGGYFNEDRTYRRSIVTYSFDSPLQFADSHTYPKGGLVLHNLRHLLGDAAWWAGIRHYLKKHGPGTVDTSDFRMAMEEATGRDLGRFFEQWVYSAGYPELRLSKAYDAESKTVSLTVEQIQTTEWGTPQVFDIDTTVQIHAGGQISSYPVKLHERKATWYFPAATQPQLVVFDPNHHLITSVHFERSDQELRYQLEKGELLDRIEAARLLGERKSEQAAAALIARAASEPSWGVRRAIMSALGEVEQPAARDALLRAINDEKVSRVRSAAGQALGKYKINAVGEALGRALNTDGSYYVRAASAQALGETKLAGVYEKLVAALEQKSHLNVVAAGALRGLGTLQDRRALAHVKKFAQYGAPEGSRGAAVSSLAKFGGEEGVVDLLRKLLDDPVPQVRNSAVSALREIGSKEALEILKGARGKPFDPFLWVDLRDAVLVVEQKQADVGRMETLEKKVEELRQTVEELKRPR